MPIPFKAVLVPLLLLSAVPAGCRTLTPEELRAADEARCSDYGFRRGTDAYAACLQRIDLSRQADRRQILRDMDEPIVIYRPVYIR
ncbi:hypothetical protein [Aureimonas altamirensis]|uniref:hypothetical protein n=1 Tax=Aureimonas altamirensis TaxID=370622 RepID=UPI002552FA16|nr:hypothetical protein [Aureimonas altamirensis]